jgi:hypothetical protein
MIVKGIVGGVMYDSVVSIEESVYEWKHRQDVKEGIGLVLMLGTYQENPSLT